MTSTIFFQMRPNFKNAFSVIIGTVLLGVLAIAYTHRLIVKNKRMTCANNLRELVAGFSSFAGENKHCFPWQLKKDNPHVDSSFFLMPISEHLSSTKVFLCPADKSGARSNSIQRVSYFISPDALSIFDVVLAGDKNILTTDKTRCGSFFYLQQITLPDLKSWVSWSSALHGDAGHIAFSKGNVEFIPTRTLSTSLYRSGNSSYGIHALLPIE